MHMYLPEAVRRLGNLKEKMHLVFSCLSPSFSRPLRVRSVDAREAWILHDFFCFTCGICFCCWWWWLLALHHTVSRFFSPSLSYQARRALKRLFCLARIIFLCFDIHNFYGFKRYPIYSSQMYLTWKPSEGWFTIN